MRVIAIDRVYTRKSGKEQDRDNFEKTTFFFENEEMCFRALFKKKYVPH